MADPASVSNIGRSVAVAFDSAFYCAAYEDVAAAGSDPLKHFMGEGWREGRDPAPWFSTNAYLERYPDTEGSNPFVHYLEHGWREGRDVEPSVFAVGEIWRAADAGVLADWSYSPRVRGDDKERRHLLGRQAKAAAARTLMDAEFDHDFYLARNLDIAAEGADPFEHFLTTGWREGRNPNRDFSVLDYLENNPDIAAADINPFEHYLVAGRAEGRADRNQQGFHHQIISRLKPIAQRRAQARGRTLDAPRGELAAWVAILADKGVRDGLHVTVSHDDFTAHLGGVQLCLQRESAAANAAGRDHLHLYPMAAWPTVRAADPELATGVLWNGRDLGGFTASQIVAALQARPESGSGRDSFAIHNMLGHSAAELVQILEAIGLARGFLWLHDFTSVCAGVHLLRNDVVDCGAPPSQSPACGICIYGAHRQSHREAHDVLFSMLDLTVVAPSVSAFETWRAATGADRPFIIHPHARLVAPSPAKRTHGPLNVAFLGAPAPHKGWHAFVALAERFSTDPRYRFTHFAGHPVGHPSIGFQPVSVSAADPLAMRDALDAQSVDVAVLWSLCRETFSFSAYEALAAGAAIITNPDSGNIAALANEPGQGRVLADEAELQALFASGEVMTLSSLQRQSSKFELEFSALTLDLVGAA